MSHAGEERLSSALDADVFEDHYEEPRLDVRF